MLQFQLSRIDLSHLTAIYFNALYSLIVLKVPLNLQSFYQLISQFCAIACCKPQMLVTELLAKYKVHLYSAIFAHMLPSEALSSQTAGV